MTLSQTIRAIIPPSIRPAFHMLRWYPTWYVGSTGRASQRRLKALKDRHKGDRCFLICNGPSLQQMDLSPLRNEITIGLNRIYLAFEEWGFSTDYLVSVNRLMIEQVGDEIEKLPITKFIGWSSRKFVKPDDNTIYVRTSANPGFHKDASGELWEGATVTFVAMQLAYHLGFDEVILIGVDHKFETSGPAHSVVTSTGPDPNHFSGDYFPQGFKWQLPDLDVSRESYEMAKTAFAEDGRTIVDATVCGELDVFPKVKFESFFVD